MGNPWKGTRSRRFRTVAGVIACCTSLSLIGTVSAPSASSSPNDAPATSLVAAISQAQARVDALNLEIGSQREAMNQALVDLHDAQSRAEQARRGAESARQRLSDSQAAVEAARRELDEVTRSHYRFKGTASAFGATAGTHGRKDVLDRSLYLRQQVQEKRAKLEDVKNARITAANEESILREASELAQRLAQQAEDAERATRASYEQSQQLIAEQEAQRDQAQRELNESQEKLGDIRPQVAQANPSPASTAPVGAAGPRPEVAQAEEEAVQQQADEAEQASVASVREELARQAPEVSSLSDAQILEALSTATAASDGADDQSGNPVTQAAAIAAATAIVGSSQADHASMDNPYGTNSSDVIAAFANGLSSVLSSQDSGIDLSPGLEDVLPRVDTAETITQSLIGSVTRSGSAPASNSAAVETVIARAMSQVGTPYVWGGGDANGPTAGLNGGSVRGFDCSGLVLYAYAAAGISLPHYTGYQYQRGTQIDPSEAQRGDLLFWGPNGSQHVAIYLGDGTMIEAPTFGQTVQVSPVRYSGMSAKAVRLL
ncbi:NlpC/P60 family protein [Corynebacterium mayonis]|uniref:NlpC/P60 family protein n=1 Tax=Corynebacterium mayonis TaxID=3062461 RepID=UPI0031408A92